MAWKGIHYTAPPTMMVETVTAVITFDECPWKGIYVEGYEYEDDIDNEFEDIYTATSP